MKTTTIYKTNRPYLGIWDWTFNEINDYQRCTIFSEPYEVEIPKGIKIIRDAESGEKYAVNEKGDLYTLTIWDSKKENSNPYLIGMWKKDIKKIKLKIIKKEA